MAEYRNACGRRGPTEVAELFEDVLPALQRLREAGVKQAVISNADDDVTELCTHMAFAHEMNIIVTSAIIGYEKPDARTYRAAFEPLGVDPAARCTSAINRNPTLPAPRCRSACVPP